MMESLASREQFVPGRQEGTRVLDRAVGILVAWQHCSTYAAFRELVRASERHRLSIFAIAAALVNLASGDDTQAISSAAKAAAEREWSLYSLL
ncbi:ANTAR domain-containing protein [Mycobacterium lentiflavum]|uniref:ANTAR domain-containing protein n=1 Tax=Mycobacterium lentiflavum TaxID=141349 RepID=A0A0E3WCY6_MYCLN|nr:ANTAR domain-containing protein [Mycobacterium lentiflavum]CQD17129.1 ANTAR domain-containing protein [Mycobacterium lentiflavum]